MWIILHNPTGREVVVNRNTIEVLRYSSEHVEAPTEIVFGSGKIQIVKESFREIMQAKVQYAT